MRFGVVRPNIRPAERAKVLARLTEPRPIMYYHTQHEGLEGPYVETTAVWDAADGRMCRACPLGECTFQEGREGMGLCHYRRPGKLAETAPSTLPGA